MATRTLSAQVGEGQERLTIEVTGSPCGIEDAQLLVMGLLKQLAKDRKQRKTPEPCGCKEAK